MEDPDRLALLQMFRDAKACPGHPDELAHLQLFQASYTAAQASRSPGTIEPANTYEAWWRDATPHMLFNEPGFLLERDDAAAICHFAHYGRN